MTSRTSRQVQGVVSAIATQSAISGNAELEAALKPCVLPDGRTAIVLGKALEDAVRNATIKHREQPEPDVTSAILEQATAHLDAVWLTIWRMSKAPHLNSEKTAPIGTNLAHATTVLYGLRDMLTNARRDWDALDEAERLEGPDDTHEDEAGEPGAPTQRWENIWTEDAWLAAHPGKALPDVNRLKVTCAARLYERASTDVDAGTSTHAACKRAIEACENDEPWDIGDRDGDVFVERIERIGEVGATGEPIEVPDEFREGTTTQPRTAGSVTDALGRSAGKQAERSEKDRSMTSDANADVELVDEREGFAGHGRLEVLKVRFRMTNGRMGPTLEREVLHRGDGAAVAPVDVENEEVVLIEQFRPGAWRGTGAGWISECPAGTIGEGESARTTAWREALEEAGCRITDPIHVASVLTNPAALTETVHIFCARIAGLDGHEVHAVTAEGEETRRRRLPITEIEAAIANGEIRDAKTTIALQHLQLHWPQIRDRWANNAGGTAPQ